MKSFIALLSKLFKAGWLFPETTIMVIKADEKGMGKRSLNFSEEEKVALLQFVQHHKTQLLGKAGCPGHGDDKVEERKARYWQKCADVVNGVGGQHRDWKKVRKQWFSLKDKAKNLKGEMEKTGVGPRPNVSIAMQLCMEVMARESLEGIRRRNTEVDPTGTCTATPEMSQSSSQESMDESTAAPPPPLTTTSLTPPTSKEIETPTTTSLIALQKQMQKLQAEVEALSNQPSSLQRATEIRQLKFQEELLKIEKAKLDLQRQTLDVQKKMLAAMEKYGAKALFSSET